MASGQGSVASRAELVRMLVLNVISDDYENLVVAIEPPVVRDGAMCGLEIDRTQIVRALTELVELGWAKAYRFGGVSREVPPPIDGMLSLKEMEDPLVGYFYITPAGRKAQDSYPYPFDDQGEVRKDWKPPES